ncbi:NUDIX hydrolase [Candidatus Woesearchaeota archaeon]|nr:NUDIX hydrolase [Candidatus Woesearchaeota archaeon]
MKSQPGISVDIIIQYSGGIVLVKRKNPPFGWALPGGFVEAGESLEEAAVREAKEETNLKIDLQRQLHAYSDPGRDPRQHVITVAYIAKGTGYLIAGDDAKEAEVFKINELPKLVFDHEKILADAELYLDD